MEIPTENLFFGLDTIDKRVTAIIEELHKLQMKRHAIQQELRDKYHVAPNRELDPHIGIEGE